MSGVRKFLGDLRAGARGTIISVGVNSTSSGSRSTPNDVALSRRMLEMGLIEGAFFEVPFDAPYSHDPMAVKVRGAVIALRRSEANLIEVQVEGATE